MINEASAISATVRFLAVKFTGFTRAPEANCDIIMCPFLISSWSAAFSGGYEASSGVPSTATVALVDFGDQITKIYHQGVSIAQLTFEQPCGGHHTFEHHDEMRRDRICGRSKNTLLNSERRGSPKFTRAVAYPGRFMIIQRCWAHILREAEDLAMAAGKGSLEEELHQGLRGIFHAAKQIAADTAGSGGADADTCMDLKMQVLAVASLYGKLPFAGTLRNAAPNLFTFLRYPGMPPTNNATEGDIRDGVVRERKIRQKMTTKEGMHAFAVIHSFTQTCRKLRLVPWKQVVNIVRNRDWNIFDEAWRQNALIPASFRPARALEYKPVPALPRPTPSVTQSEEPVSHSSGRLRPSWNRIQLICLMLSILPASRADLKIFPDVDTGQAVPQVAITPSTRRRPVAPNASAGSGVPPPDTVDSSAVA